MVSLRFAFIVNFRNSLLDLTYLRDDNSFESVASHLIDRAPSPYYDQAKAYLLATTSEWKTEPLITSIKLTSSEERCSHPAFSRQWPGTRSYETEVVSPPATRRLADEAEQATADDLQRQIDELQAQLDAAEAINEKEAEVTKEVDDALDKYDTD